MAHMINWNPEEKIPELARAGMEILTEACVIIVQDMKAHLYRQMKWDWRQHGPHKTGKDADKIWTERKYAAMAKSIRLVKKYDTMNSLFTNVANRNIWIMAGNYKTWWAVQMEYGHGDWRGGKKSFFRPGIAGALPKIRALLAARKIK